MAERPCSIISIPISIKFDEEFSVGLEGKIHGENSSSGSSEENNTSVSERSPPYSKSLTTKFEPGPGRRQIILECSIEQAITNTTTPNENEKRPPPAPPSSSTSVKKKQPVGMPVQYPTKSIYQSSPGLNSLPAARKSYVSFDLSASNPALNCLPSTPKPYDAKLTPPKSIMKSKSSTKNLDALLRNRNNTSSSLSVSTAAGLMSTCSQPKMNEYLNESQINNQHHHQRDRRSMSVSSSSRMTSKPVNLTQSTTKSSDDDDLQPYFLRSSSSINHQHTRSNMSFNYEPPNQHTEQSVFDKKPPIYQSNERINNNRVNNSNNFNSLNTNNGSFNRPESTCSSASTGQNGRLIEQIFRDLLYLYMIEKRI